MNKVPGLAGNVLITGGSGTLGRAILRRAQAEDWPWEITVYSRDVAKHAALRREFPRVHFVPGDVTDRQLLTAVMAGQDVVIHAAAQKHIPAGQEFPFETVGVNVHGSWLVAQVAVELGVEHVVGISTDKVCNPANVYGASKLVMEQVFRQMAETYSAAYGTSFHLCRYGNVLGSAGSVLRVWARQYGEGQPITLTDPSMTRFWMTENQAVDTVLAALEAPAGVTVIPVLPAASMSDLASALFPHATVDVIGRRPGEKLHETLFTAEEVGRVRMHGRPHLDDRVWWLLPEGEGTGDYESYTTYKGGYHSHTPDRWLKAEELRAMVGV